MPSVQRVVPSKWNFVAAVAFDAVAWICVAWAIIEKEASMWWFLIPCLFATTGLKDYMKGYSGK